MRQRRYKGNPPGGEGWSVTDLGKVGRATWSLWIREPKDDSGWVALKVAANGRAARKANFYESYSLVEKRLTRNNSVTSMKELRPELYDIVLAKLISYKWNSVLNPHANTQMM